ncbi:MFS transporter [Butyricicoccus sp. OM04-18BH]|nr:MFS transporter [Butyricicoccus sp. AM42-5AC]RHT59298.1 MFS transporter [Butyricicoccus sp. AM29-23AC]RHV42864.1 MFS transporter [Butyricicoccus sp. OM04-18BH]
MTADLLRSAVFLCSNTRAQDFINRAGSRAFFCASRPAGWRFSPVFLPFFLHEFARLCWKTAFYPVILLSASKGMLFRIFSMLHFRKPEGANTMKAFLSSISRNKRFVVAELFLVYFAHGLGSIMLGSVLPDLRAAYGLDYQLSGTLISSQSVGYLLIGLLSGAAVVKWGLKRSYLVSYYLFAVGFIMLLVTGSPVLLLTAMFLTGISKGGITDYNNRVMSEYANGSATPLNMMHASYAFGACVAPLAVLACQKLGGENGWRLALEIAIVLLTFGLVFGLFMKMDEEKPAESSQKSATDYGFFRERLFWLTTALCFFYEAVEASMMGWLTTFYIDSGVLAAGAAQIVTSLLWISLLVGRFSCSVIAARFRPWQMITVMCFGIAAFLVLLVLGTSLPVLIVATIGLGLCMSGMYGTTVSNAGDLFSRYPASMGIYVTLNGLGAAAAPAAIGVAANHGGIRIGFALLLIAAAMLVVSALCNMRYLKKR